LGKPVENHPELGKSSAAADISELLGRGMGR